MKRVSVLMAPLLLAACGGNPITFAPALPSGPVSQSEVEAAALSFMTMRDEVMDLAPTLDAGVPETGRATFTGKVSMAVTPGDTAQALMLYGDTTIVADFAEPLVMAQMDNFTGEAAEGTFVRLNGELMMEDGRIGLGTDGSITGTYRGALTGTNISIVTEGTVTGAFRDMPIAAVSFSGLDTDALHNGEAGQVVLTGVATE